MHQKCFHFVCIFLIYLGPYLNHHSPPTSITFTFLVPDMNLGNTGPLYLNSVLFFTAAPSVVDASPCYTDAFVRNEGLTLPLPGGLPAGSPRLWLLRDGISWRQPPWPSGASLYLMTDPQRGIKVQDPPPIRVNLGGPAQLHSFLQGWWRLWLRLHCSPTPLAA